MKHRYGALACAALLTGCASITDGTDQTLIVSVTPKEARCVVERNTVELGSVSGTQSTITVTKGAKDILITCKAAGYDDKVARLVSSTQTAGMMSFLFLDLGITDMVTGAMWKYPSSTSIALERNAATAPAVPAAAAATPQLIPAIGPAVAQPVVVVPVSTAGPLVPGGQDSFQVEKLAREQGCNPNSRAALTAKGPGFELYTLQCSDTVTWSVRCEYGQCRVLR